MNLHDFEEFVSPKIYERGLEYHLLGYVNNLTHQANQTWVASVKGSETYKITVKLEDDEIVSSYCTCPYAYGPTCKHEVAVYLELADIVDENSLNTNIITPHSPDKLETVLDSLSQNDLIKIIKEHASEDSIFKNEVIANYATASLNKNDYHSIISSSLDSEMGYNDFIPWNATYSACKGANTVIEKVEQLLDQDNLSEAFIAATAILEEMIPALQYADDSNGNIGECIETSLELIHNITQHELSEDTRKMIFNYLIKEWNHDRFEGWSWGLELLQLAIELYKGKEEEKELAKAIDSCFTKNQLNERYKWETSSIYNIKLHFLNTSGQTKEAKKFFNKNLHLPNFREIAIKTAFNKKQYKKVIKLTDEGCIKNHKYAGTVSQWQTWKLKAYQELNDKSKTRELSLDFFLNNKLDYYSIYQETFSKQDWPKQLEALIVKSSKSHYSFSLLSYIYSKENKLPQLLDLLQKHPEKIQHFEGKLLAKYPREVHSIHENNLRQKAESLNSRRAYSNFCYYDLNHLCNINGQDNVQKLIAEFRIKYKRRTAMMEELDKFEAKRS